ncbi:hypothetical protein ACFLV9_00225 [Chloroflexota bacterium]
MIVERNYSIHNVISFKIVTKTGLINRLLSNVDIEYENFKSMQTDEPDFTVFLGDFSPSNNNSYILDDSYYIRDEHLYCKDSYKIANWKLQLEGFDQGKITAHISHNIFGGMRISLIIDFLIRFVMNEKGYPFIHGSCVSKDDHAYLFPAVSGGGKTVIALNLVERGYNFLGDNFTIIHNNRALSFLSPLNIFIYNLSPRIKRYLGMKNRTILELKNILYKLTLGYAKIFTKVNVREVFQDQVVDSSGLSAICLLIPKEKLQVKRMDKEELIEHLVVNYKAEANSCLEYTLEYSYMFPQSKLSRHWDRYRENLDRNISDSIPTYMVEVPNKYDADTFDRIINIIQNETDS